MLIICYIAYMFIFYCMMDSDGNEKEMVLFIITFPFAPYIFFALGLWYVLVVLRRLFP